ncbi:MAG: hypothetical protein HY716_00885 [Planctomycetes bacterium]|nr:hypothetical protein [Planctomycetota bacterium]
MKLIPIMAAWAFLQAGPGGKVEWFRDMALARKKAELQQKALLFYFHDGGPICKGYDDTVFSSDDVIREAHKSVPVFVDCSKEGAHEDLRTKYSVSAMPTLTVAKPDGAPYKEIELGDPARVAAQLRKIAEQFPGVPSFWTFSLEEAVESGKERKMPVAIYFHDGKTDVRQLAENIRKKLKSRVDKCLWVEMAATEEDSNPVKVKYGFRTLPTLGIYDPRDKDMATEPLGLFAIFEHDQPATVQKYFDKALKKFKR